VINLSQLNFNHWFSSNGSQLLLRGCNRKSILDVGPYWYHYKSLTNDDHKKHKHNPPQPPFILILPSTLFPTLSSLLSAPFLSLHLGNFNHNLAIFVLCTLSTVSFHSLFLTYKAWNIIINKTLSSKEAQAPPPQETTESSLQITTTDSQTPMISPANSL
jgi:hypothetical protein